MKNKAAVTLITLAIALLASVVFPPTGRTAPSTNGRVLILDSTVYGGATSPEALAANANGKAVDVVDDATWMSMTAEQFAAYDALILGDPYCGSTPPAAAESNTSVWGPVVNGNIVVIATDATFHTLQGTPGAQQLVNSGVSFAVAAPNKTGAYITLSCYYQAFGPGTPVPMLSGLSASGNFTVASADCWNDVHIVAVHPALTGLSDGDLSGWDCSIHERFDSRPSDFTPLAIARDPEGGPPLPGSEPFPDGSHGVPYILGRGEGFPCTPPPSGLVSWWPFDETSGTTASDISGANNGTLSGTTPVAGEVAGARRFEVGDISTAAGSGSLNITGQEVTIDAWIKLENNPTSNQNFTAQIGKTQYPNGQPYLVLFEGGAIGGNSGNTLPQNQWQFEYILTNADGTRQHDQGTGVITTVDGLYHHFAMTDDGANVRLYVDGALRYTNGFSGNLQNTPTVPVTVNGGAPFSADEVEIFNWALSASEIQAIFRAGSAGKCKPCTPDTWATKAPSLQAVAGAAGAVVNGQFYVIDGSGGGIKPPPQVYDPVANSWSSRAPDPIVRANTSVGVINNKIYVAEGWINADSNRATQALRIYDPATNSWAIGKSSQVARGGAASAVISGKLYVTGGSKNGGRVQPRDLEIYDPVRDKWSAGALMPTATSGSGAALNGKFYVVGGSVHGTDTGVLQIYDSATNRWTQGSPMPSPRSGVLTGVINGKLYAIGGNHNGVNLSTVEIYDPASNTWTTGTSEPTARYGAAGGVINSKLYVTGGYDATNVINGSLEVYTAVCP